MPSPALNAPLNTPPTASGSPLDATLTEQPCLLMDGGMGQELVARGLSTESPLWSAQALLDDPDLIRGVHQDYVDAGADLLITNSYGSNPNRLREFGLQDKAEMMNALSGQLAREAADAAPADRKVLVAGCLPPLAGSYRPDHLLPFETMVDCYADMIGWLAPYCDLFLAETMSAALEGKAAATAIARAGQRAWIAWTLSDDKSVTLRSGESVAEAMAALDGLPVEAVLYNCSFPEALTAAMPVLAHEAHKRKLPFGGYANGFTEIPENWRFRDGVDHLEARRDLTPERYLEHVQAWYHAGARLLGGCCEVGPAHIAAMQRWREHLSHDVTV